MEKQDKADQKAKVEGLTNSLLAGVGMDWNMGDTHKDVRGVVNN
jgi:hypothetical protein